MYHDCKVQKEITKDTEIQIFKQVLLYRPTQIPVKIVDTKTTTWRKQLERAYWYGLC